MKSFKLYIVFFLVVGIAVGCADENRAFKPKSFNGAFNANGKAALDKKNGSGDDDSSKKDDTKNADTDKDPKQQSAPKIAKDIATEQAEAQRLQFQNGNKPAEQKKTDGATVKAAPTQESPQTTGKTQAQAEQVLSLEKEEAAFFSNESRVTAEAKNIAKTILGVTLSRYPVADQNKFFVEVLTYVKIGAEKETIVSRGKLAQPGANTNGIPLYLNSTISRVDNEYSIDDVVKVKAYCEKGSCDKITVIVTVLTEVKKGEGSEKAIVPVFAGYRFELTEGTQADKFTKMFVFTGVGATVGIEYKSYEDALATAQMPNFDEKGQPIVKGSSAATSAAAGSADADKQEKEVLAEAQKAKAAAEEAKLAAQAVDVEGISQISPKARVAVAGAGHVDSVRANNERVAAETQARMEARANEKSLADERQEKAMIEDHALKLMAEKRLQQADIATAEAHEAQGVQTRGMFARVYDSIDNSISNAYNSSASTVRYWGTSVKNWWNGPEKKEETKKVETAKAADEKKAAAPVVTIPATEKK